ncbi:biofilm peroxide resistance protein BsmA [Dickeya dianthicola]|uniref:biofilm peroxide resistance protein BsmA n=1 Tax=Dickeya dianthicola TaxID=204039 RepID=UPI001F609071|nr:biofilm peroxide resistance protein BsmA [Dickeya dianthicola]MCI4214509.1 biofilm peroxide resistance protein BsmA [Dickeya dianthicola]MCI4231458.1 biofilm peroxide resistance protein BsmA [Dickeya dianthicola]
MTRPSWLLRVPPLNRVVLSALLSMLISGCTLLAGKPVPPPPPAEQAVDVSREQSYLLEKAGSVSVDVRGSLDDAVREIQRQANARGMPYYRVVSLTESEHVRRDSWHGYAIFYRPPAAAARP